jgi:hypothetical protein
MGQPDCVGDLPRSTAGMMKGCFRSFKIRMTLTLESAYGV